MPESWQCAKRALLDLQEGQAFFCLIWQAGGLALAEGRDSGEGFAFEEFEGGASAGGAVGDLVGDAEFFGGCGGVATSDDGDGS